MYQPNFRKETKFIKPMNKKTLSKTTFGIKVHCPFPTWGLKENETGIPIPIPTRHPGGIIYQFLFCNIVVCARVVISGV